MSLYLVSWDLANAGEDRHKAVDEAIRDLGKPGKGMKCVETTRTVESDRSAEEIELRLNEICHENGDKFVVAPVVANQLRGSFGLPEDN